MYRKNSSSEESDSQSPTPRYVSWAVFVWSLAIFATILGYLFYEVRDVRSYMDSIRDSNQVQFAQIQSQLSQIQTDISWIKLELSKK